MNEYVIESILAFLIGTSYVFGGMMILAGYRNGVYLVLGTLVFSGLLSFVYNDEWSPLSIGLDGFTAPAYTFFCSAFCMILTAYRSWSLHQSSRMDGQKVFSESLTTHPRPRRILERRNQVFKLWPITPSSSGILWKGDVQVVKPWLRFEQSLSCSASFASRFLRFCRSCTRGRWAICQPVHMTKK